MPVKKIIFATRKDFFSKFGGDNIQLLKTKEYLEKKYNLEIIICTDENQISEDKTAQIVHIFNMHAIETIDFVNAAGKANKKIALSTIYWDLSHSYLMTCLAKVNLYPSNKSFYYLKDILLELINKIYLNFDSDFKSKSYYWPKTGLYEVKRREIIDKSDLLLPNSPEEGEMLGKTLKMNLESLNKKTFVVPNSVDIQLIVKENSDCRHEIINSVKDFVMQAARIEPTKNQLNVIKALYDVPEIPIVFIGAIGHEGYYKAVKNLAEKRGNVYFVDKIPHEEVLAFYQRAKVHVLPSFRESPGLSSLEALFSGCQIVVSSKEYCPVKYYEFDKYGHICNPYDPASIKQAILQAYNNPKDIHLPDYYKYKFSYENVADATYQAYCTLMD